MPDIKALFDTHQATIKPAEEAAQAMRNTLDALVKGCTENAANLGGAIATVLGMKIPASAAVQQAAIPNELKPEKS